MKLLIVQGIYKNLKLKPVFCSNSYITREIDLKCFTFEIYILPRATERQNKDEDTVGLSLFLCHDFLILRM